MRFQRSFAPRPRRGRGRGRGQPPSAVIQETNRIWLDKTHAHPPGPSPASLSLPSSTQARPCRVDRNPLGCHSSRHQLDPCCASPPVSSPPTASPSSPTYTVFEPSVLAGPPLQHGPPAIPLPRVSCRTPQPPPIWCNAARSLQFSTLEPKPWSLRRLPSFSR